MTGAIWLPRFVDVEAGGRREVLFVDTPGFWDKRAGFPLAVAIYLLILVRVSRMHAK